MGRSKAENSWRKRTSKADCKEEVVITRGKLDGGVRDDIIKFLFTNNNNHSNLFFKNLDKMSKDEMSFYKKKKIDSRYTKDETPQDEVGRHLFQNDRIVVF